MKSYISLIWSAFAFINNSIVLAAHYSNPLKETAGADPYIVWHDGYYYLTTTSNPTIELTRATTLEGLKDGENKVVWTDEEPSRKCDLWAPEMYELDGTWYIYYSASACNDESRRPHVLKGGSSPWDNYTYLAQLVDDTWGIDGGIVNLLNKRYFVYSCRENNLQSLCISYLEAPDRILGRSIISQPTQDWETSGIPVNEGPVALYNDGKTWLAFSASFCGTPDYALGLLEFTGGDPMEAGSWRKTGPHFTSANGNFGPGHNGFFQSPDQTEWWNVYHATPKSEGGCDDARYTSAQKLNFKNGQPDFGEPGVLRTTLSGPSGE